jgi:hypothetical protein
MFTVITYAQTEPEAPASVLRPEKQKNGWQIAFYSGVSMNEYYEGYDIAYVIDFLADETSWNVPFGFAVNIPVFNDFALYLRAGTQNMKTNFFNGEVDSLESVPEVGEIGYDMDFTFNIVHVDVLFRLIGDNEGERVYFGPSFGYVQKKQITVRKEEFLTGFTRVLEDRDMPGADNFFPTFVIGAEYAYVPVKDLYLIPAIEVNFGWEKVSSLQRLRATYYRLLFNVSYQVF